LSLPASPRNESGAVVPAPGPKRKPKGGVWVHLIIVFLAALVVFLPGLQHYGIIDPSDGLYAEGAREMLERSDWVSPSSNYQPFYEKPILIYWMIIASYKLLGVHEFAARLPVALCGILSSLALLLFVRPFLGARAALFSSICLLSTPLFVTVGRVAITDVPLTLFMTVGALGLFSRLHGAHWCSLAFAYGALGLALLIKGPVPVALVALLIVVYLFWTGPRGSEGRYRWWWQKAVLLHPLLGTAVMLSIAAPWYIAEGLATKGAFYQEFFIKQNFGRAMGTVNHQNPFWFYIPIYFAGFFPWSVIALLDIRRYFGLLKKQWKPGAWIPSKRANLELFSILWLLLILGIFTVLKTKLATYILPIAPPLAILSGSLLDRAVRMKAPRLKWILLTIVFVILPLVAVCAPTLCYKFKFDINTLYAFMGFGFFAWCFLTLATWAAFRKKIEVAITAIVCACAFACGTFVPTGLQSHYLQSDYHLFQMLRRVVRDKAQVALYMRDSPAVNFYLRRPIKEIKTLLDYKQYVETGRKPHYLLVTTDVMEQMKEPPPMWTLLEKRAKWHLFAIDPNR
jgi:4-amino-4-deoxy-L-arabinose transferase-like glycosyltransferase